SSRPAPWPADLDGRGRHPRGSQDRTDGPRGARHARRLRSRQPRHARRPQGRIARTLADRTPGTSTDRAALLRSYAGCPSVRVTRHEHAASLIVSMAGTVIPWLSATT